MSKNLRNTTPLAADVRDLAIVASLMMRWGYKSADAVAAARQLMSRCYVALSRELRPKGQRSVFGK